VKAYLRTFGCRANQYDTEAVRAMIEAAGGEIVATPEDADLAVFNSCAVTAAAEADLRQSVRRAARRAPALRTVVMGCAAARDDGTIAALPTVERVVPGGDLLGVAEAIGLSAPVLPPNVQTGTPRIAAHSGWMRRALHVLRDDARAWRGPVSKHRRAGGRGRRLAEHHPEIVLTGIHIGHYGVDTGTTLSALVERLVRDVPGFDSDSARSRRRRSTTASRAVRRTGSPRAASARAASVGSDAVSSEWAAIGTGQLPTLLPWSASPRASPCSGLALTSSPDSPERQRMTTVAQ
jgi:hypothetical protein